MTYSFLFKDFVDYFFIFCRLGGLFTMFPGLGEMYVPVRVRLIAAIVVSFVLTPLVKDTLPALSLLSNATVVYAAQELLIGMLLGLIGRITLSALHVTSQIIGMQSSLSSATIFNPNLGAQDNMIGAALISAATVMIFASDLHYKVLEAFIYSYERFPPSGPFAYVEISAYCSKLVQTSFAFGIQLAMPFMIAGLFINFCLGLLNRLMPQLQVYFLAMPLQILIALIFLVLTMGLMLTYFNAQLLKTYTDFI